MALEKASLLSLSRNAVGKLSLNKPNNMYQYENLEQFLKDLGSYQNRVKSVKFFEVKCNPDICLDICIPQHDLVLNNNSTKMLKLIMEGFNSLVEWLEK